MPGISPRIHLNPLTQMTWQRWFFSLLFLGVLPTLLVLGIHLWQMGELEEQLFGIEMRAEQRRLWQQKQGKNAWMHRQYQESNPQYLHQLTFLKALNPQWMEKKVYALPLFRESQWQLASQLTMVQEHLEQLVNAIELPASQKPQLIITHLQIDRTATDAPFTLSTLQILQRTFSPLKETP